MAVQDRKAREFSRREDEILQAALGLFQSDNWQSITVEQIAREADVGKGTIYKHFTSKDDIYAHLAMKFQRQILSEFSKIERDQPVLERLRQHLACAWHMHLSSKELHRVFLYCSRTEFRTQMTPNQLSELMDVEAQVARPTRALILEGIEQGLFPRKTPALCIFQPIVDGVSV